MKQMAIPFQIGRDGGVATVSDPVRTLSQRVRALTATLPGTRAMRATLGVDSPQVLFDWDPTIAQRQLDQMVTDAVALWEPSARVVSVRPSLTPDGAQIIALHVDISAGDPLPMSPSPQYQIRISGNGDVQRRG